VKIDIAGQVYEMEVQEGTNLLLEAVSRSIPVPIQCTTGRCGTCRVYVVGGMENLNDYSELELYRLREEVLAVGGRLACQTYVYGDATFQVKTGKE
jgi:ferredoxin